MLAQFKEQGTARKEKSKALAEDQKRLEMVAMGLDPNLAKGDVQAKSRGELMGHIESLLSEAGRKKDAQDQANRDRQFQAAGDAQKSLEKSRADTLDYNKDVHAYTKKQDRRARRKDKRPSDLTKLIRKADQPGGGSEMNTLMGLTGFGGVDEARNLSRANPKSTVSDLQKFQQNQQAIAINQRKLDQTSKPAGTSEEVTTPKGKVIGHLVHTGDGFPKFVGPGTASAKPAELQVADALIQAAKDGEKAKFMALAHKHRIESKFYGVFYPPWIVELAKVQGWTLRENPKK
jgi:hypothetical protein